MNKIFVDTSAWIAVTVKMDQNHKKANYTYGRLLSRKAGLVTSDYVIDESITRIRYDSGHREALRFYEIIMKSIELCFLTLRRIDAEIWEDSIAIFRKYSDRKLSFTDCTSFALAGRLKIKDVFAFDEDFEVMGFHPIHKDARQ